MSGVVRFDQLDPVHQQAIQKNLATLHAKGASDAEIESYLRDDERLAPTGASSQAPDIHAEYRSGALAKRMAAANAADSAAEEAPKPGIGTKILGTLASLAHNIPGAEAAQAGVRSLTRGQSYRDALSDIQGAEQAAPAPARIGANLVGGTIAAMAMPKIPGLAQGGAALQGAQYGTLSGLLSSNPDANVSDRVHGATADAALGALGGKAGEMIGNTARALGSETLGAGMLARSAARKAGDITNYGQAAAEGAGLSHPALTTALDKPDIKPFADMLRGSRQFANADDATIARETYKLMTRQQGGLAQSLKMNGFDAAKSLQHDELGLAKQELLDAAEQIMPSFRNAVGEHADASQGIDAFSQGADAAKRILKGTPVAGRRLGTQSEEAFQGNLANMSPEQARDALAGMLGRAKENVALSPNPLTLFGVGKSAVRLNRLAPSLSQADAAAGTGRTVDILRALGITLPSSSQ